MTVNFKLTGLRTYRLQGGSHSVHIITMMDSTQEQEKAISILDRNLQIIACAGSGKTQVISQRIVEILKKQKNIIPANITAFTYTDKAAAELKSRIIQLCKEQLPELKGLIEM